MLFPLQVSLPAAHSLRLDSSRGRVTAVPGKREVGVGLSPLSHHLPFVLAEVPLPVCHCRSENRPDTPSPPPSLACLLLRSYNAGVTLSGDCTILGKVLNFWASGSQSREFGMRKKKKKLNLYKWRRGIYFMCLSGLTRDLAHSRHLKNIDF